MTGEQILAMFLGEMSDSVLDIECLLLSGLDSRRAKVAVLCMYSLDMLGITIHLLHGCHGQTQVEDRTSMKRDPRTREGPKVQVRKVRRRVKKEMMRSTRQSLYTGPLRRVTLTSEVRGFAILGRTDWICSGGGDKDEGPYLQ
jgi:hypothetical protein